MVQSTRGAITSGYGLLCDTLWLELNIGGIEPRGANVTMPQLSDQPTNAKFVEELWQVGVKAKKNKERIVTWDELEMCIKEVTAGERSEEIVKYATKWRKFVIRAVKFWWKLR